MPMFRSFVPRWIQPWLYVFIAVTFQLSGGVYLGSLNSMIGETALMREDIQMCLYANLAGMAIYFPILFRMKFRFTNKTLLSSAALGVIACNLLAPHITFLPLLWAVCFVEGVCKIQGTLECMSNIQLWITPKRDFSVFFPVLHIVILGSMQLSDLLTVHIAHHLHWSLMYTLITGLMIVDLLIITVCTRHFRIVRKFPLFGIDWTGAMLWALLLLEVACIFNYGEVMRYAETVTVRLDWPALVGILAGCLFSLWWMHVRKLPYIRLIVVGLAALACYLAGFYFTISMDIHISQLYLPVALRGFAYAVLSATFMTCLEEIMTFQHFFQALSVFNMLHMVVGGVMGSALYARGMAWLMPDNIARYGDVLNPVTVTREGVNARQYMTMPRWQTLRRNIARSWRL